MPGVDREHSFELTDNWSLDELQVFWDGLVLETTLCRWGGNLSPEEAADRMNAQFPNRTNKFTGDMLSKILPWFSKRHPTNA